MSELQCSATYSVATKMDLKSLRAPLPFSYLYKSKDGTTGVMECSTPIGRNAMKTWTSKRVKLGVNYLQPACEYSAMLQLGSHALLNTALSIELDQTNVNSYYVHCGHDIQTWRRTLDQMPDGSASLLAQHVGAQLLLAIQDLQIRGLVHRDVTPTNVLMRPTKSGGPGDVLLGDFGLMCTAQQLAGFYTGYNLSYILPEFITFDSSTQLFCLNPDTTTLCRYATTAADVFQAGWCLYELFTGSRPPGLEYVPSGDDPAHLSSYLCAVALYDWQSAINQHVRPRCQELADLLDLMLRTEPSHRAAPAVLLQQQYLAASYQAAVADMPRGQQLWEAERKAVAASVDVVKITHSMARLNHRGVLHEPTLAEPAVQADAAAAAAAADTTASDAADSKQQQSLRKITVVSAARNSAEDLAPVTPPVAVSGEADGCESDHDDQIETEAETDDTSSSSSSTSSEECTNGDDESESESDDISSSSSGDGSSSSSSTSSVELKGDDESDTVSIDTSSSGSSSHGLAAFSGSSSTRGHAAFSGSSSNSSLAASSGSSSTSGLAASRGSSSSGGLAASSGSSTTLVALLLVKAAAAVVALVQLVLPTAAL